MKVLNLLTKRILSYNDTHILHILKIVIVIFKKIMIKKIKRNKYIIGDAPENTEEDKRLKIILKILKLNKKSMKIYFKCKSNFDDVSNYADIHNIDIDAFEEIMIYIYITGEAHVHRAAHALHAARHRRQQAPDPRRARGVLHGPFPRGFCYYYYYYYFYFYFYYYYYHDADGNKRLALDELEGFACRPFPRGYNIDNNYYYDY